MAQILFIFGQILIIRRVFSLIMFCVPVFYIQNISSTSSINSYPCDSFCLLDYIIMSCVTRKHAFCICENKGEDQLRDNPGALCVFASEIVQSLYFLNPKFRVQSLYFLNPKFRASNHLLWLYSRVCVRPGRKPQTGFLGT